MKTLITKTLLAAAMAAAIAMPAGATTVTPALDGTWNIFDVDSIFATSGGLEWIDAQFAPGYSGDGSALDFKFTLTHDAKLTVVDGAFAGDQFQLFDNGVAIGFTSVPSNTYPASVGLNFDAALVNPSYSTGVFWLSAGQHDITGLLSQSALYSGSALDATVGALSVTIPEPTELALFVLGGSLLGFFSRRRAN